MAHFSDTQKIRTIGVMSPSSSTVRERFEDGLKILNSMGFGVIVHPQSYDGANSGHQNTGNPAHKVSALRELMMNPNIDLIMASCGGNRACFMLDLLDPAHDFHKPIMGFSDTCMLLAAQYRYGVSGFFGPTVQTLTRMSEDNLALTDKILKGKLLSSSVSDAQTAISINTQDLADVTAPVFATTLSILINLFGTQYMPNLEGHILMIEDIGEETSRLDRSLWHLRQIFPSGLLKGLVFGEFLDMTDTGRPYGENLEDIIKNHARAFGCPVLMNYPIGHSGAIFPIRQGELATLTVTAATVNDGTPDNATPNNATNARLIFLSHLPKTE